MCYIKLYRTEAFMLSATIRNTKTDGSLWGTPQAIPQVTPKAEEILAFCMIARTEAEIIAHCGLNDSKNFTQKYIRPLLESGLLRMTKPDKPTSPAQKYVTVGKHG